MHGSETYGITGAVEYVLCGVAPQYGLNRQFDLDSCSWFEEGGSSQSARWIVQSDLGDPGSF